MMSSCCFCPVVCSWAAAESLWTQKFSKPGSISTKETQWASLFSWMGLAVRVAVTCLVWTASRRSALFSAAPDAPWPPSSVGICPPETHIVMEMSRLARSSCPRDVRYLWQVLCEVHQPVCAPPTQQIFLRLPALDDRQAFLDLKARPCRDSSALVGRLSNFPLAHPQHLPLAVSPMPQFNFSLHVHQIAHRLLSVHLRHLLAPSHSGSSFLRATSDL